MMSGENSSDESAIVRERVQTIIDHNTGGPQPPAARETSVISIAARAGLDPATVRSVLEELAADGEIDRRERHRGGQCLRNPLRQSNDKSPYGFRWASG